MCIIAIKTSGNTLPDYDNLINCDKSNNDGIGIAYWKYGTHEIRIKKDFENVESFIKWLIENVTKEDSCMIHFRYATHGLKDIGNRHPFPLTKNWQLLRQPECVCQMAAAHNGVITEYDRHVKYSDTQKFVMDILAEDSIKNNFDSEAIQKLISNFLSGDRLSILFPDGQVLTFGEWIRKNHILYSNDSYKTIKIRNQINNYCTRWFSKCMVCGISKQVSYITLLSKTVCSECEDKELEKLNKTNDTTKQTVCAECNKVLLANTTYKISNIGEPLCLECDQKFFSAD